MSPASGAFLGTAKVQRDVCPFRGRNQSSLAYWNETALSPFCSEAKHWSASGTGSTILPVNKSEIMVGHLPYKACFGSQPPEKNAAAG